MTKPKFLLFLMSIFFINKMYAQEISIQSQEIPLEDFFRNPLKSDFKLSPSGKYLSWLSPYKDRKNIFIQEIGSDKINRITSVKDKDIAAYFWKSEEHLIYLKDKGGDENYHLFVVDKKGGNQRDLTPFEEVRVQIINSLRDNPNYIIIGLNKRDKKVFDPYKIRITKFTKEEKNQNKKKKFTKEAHLQLLYKNPGNITNWMANWEGKLLLAIATDGVNNTLLYRENEKEEFKKIITLGFKDTLEPLAFDFYNPNVIYALSNLNGRDKKALITYDLKQNKEIEEIFKDEQVDLLGLSFSRRRKISTFISYYKEKRKLHFLDTQTKEIYEELKETLGAKEEEISITSTNSQENKFIVYLGSDQNPGAYYFYDLKSKNLASLGSIRPWLKEEQLTKMTPIKYKSRDGLIIHGYLTLPVGKEPKDLPIIINPHGGPSARDHWGYNSEVQFLASLGYGILQMNFRGSIGYGREFWKKGFKQWGQSMQDDITDGVNWLIKRKIAHPKKIAIYGASYGGYATLMGVVKTPDLYAAAVDYVGPSNMFTLLNSIPPYWEPMRKMIYEMWGDPNDKKDTQIMRENSALFHVDKIKTPLFIAQGANDPRVKQAESDQMVKALRNRGIEVEYLLKENEGHGFKNQENKFEFYRAMKKFLNKHLKKE